MKFDLRTPCKNCPFRSDATRIRFACRERAEEIEESAYRNGFPCHLSAVLVESEDEEGDYQDGFEPGPNTQHCVGYIILQLKEADWNDCAVWPGIGNSERRLRRLASQVDRKAPVFESIEDFLLANEMAEVKP